MEEYMKKSKKKAAVTAPACEDKNAPVCTGCEFCRKHSLSEGGKLLDFCHHPVWKVTRALKRRWIRKDEMGTTSPAWCPLRVPPKEG